MQTKFSGKISPVRIIREAMRIIESINVDQLSERERENIDNNLQELEELCARLHNANVTMI